MHEKLGARNYVYVVLFFLNYVVLRNIAAAWIMLTDNVSLSEWSAAFLYCTLDKGRRLRWMGGVQTGSTSFCVWWDFGKKSTLVRVGYRWWFSLNVNKANTCCWLTLGPKSFLNVRVLPAKHAGAQRTGDTQIKPKKGWDVGAYTHVEL